MCNECGCAVEDGGPLPSDVGLHGEEVGACAGSGGVVRSLLQNSERGPGTELAV